MYGSSLTFYELFIGTEKIQALSDNYPKDPDLFPYATKSICILSRWPSFFETFQKWLTELYEISVSGLALTIPIERQVSDLTRFVMQVNCSILVFWTFIIVSSWNIWK